MVLFFDDLRPLYKIVGSYNHVCDSSITINHLVTVMRSERIILENIFNINDMSPSKYYLIHIGFFFMFTYKLILDYSFNLIHGIRVWFNFHALYLILIRSWELFITDLHTSKISEITCFCLEFRKVICWNGPSFQLCCLADPYLIKFSVFIGVSERSNFHYQIIIWINKL